MKLKKILNKKNQSISKKTAAEILAASFLEFFPRSTVLDGGITDVGFYYDFSFDGIMSSDQLYALDEKMQLMVGQSVGIKTITMVPKNALEYLKHNNIKNRGLIKKLQEVDTNIVSIVQINNYVNVANEDATFLDTAGGLKYFKLYNYEKIESLDSDNEGRIRIFGALFDSSKELKKYLKKQKQYLDFNHLTIGRESNLFFPLNDKYSIRYIWNEKGVLLKNIISNFLKMALYENRFVEIQTPDDEFKNHIKKNINAKNIEYAKYSIKKIIENSPSKNKYPFYAFEEKKLSLPINDLFFGLYRANKKTIINEYIICKEEALLDEMISSLKFIMKMLKIYTFNANCVVCKYLKKKQRASSKVNFCDISIFEKALKSCDISYEQELGYGDKESLSIEFFLEDRQQWIHKGPSIKVDLFSKDNNENIFTINRSSIGPIDDLIALLLEKENGDLPFWINPEHVRIICLDDCLEYGLKIKDLCESNKLRAFVDNSIEPLNMRVHKAIKEKVSYIVFVGEKEKKSLSVTIREVRENNTEQMSIDSFIKKLQDILKRKEQEV